MKPLFYGIYPSPRNSRVATALDAIRLILDPTTRHAAHITLRGPLFDPIPRNELQRLSASIRGTPVGLGMVDSWPTRKGRCVYLHVHAPELQRVWSKRDFKEFSPHVALYDGDDASIVAMFDREPMRRLFDTWHASFPCASMVPIEKQDFVERTMKNLPREILRLRTAVHHTMQQIVQWASYTE